jgi:hypothetical protein
MKLKSIEEYFQKRSDKASDISRQLAFAGLAIIWIFHKNNKPIVPTEFVIPTLIFISSLFLDLIHYLSASIYLGTRYRNLEKQNKKDDEDVDVSLIFNKIMWIIWGLKILLILVGYIYLFILLSQLIF